MKQVRAKGKSIGAVLSAKPAPSKAKFASSFKAKKAPAAGIVSGYVKLGKDVAIPKLIQTLKSGLPIQELDDLQSNLDLPMEKLAPMLGISKATLHRRKTMGKLDVAESDRVVRFARLLGKAAAVMESIEAGRRWLMSPQVGLGSETPLQYAETEVGAREVEHLLGRIEFGVYS